MAETMECPLCGETMRLRVSEIVVQIPGTRQASKPVVREWFCPECDHFEEAEGPGPEKR